MRAIRIQRGASVVHPPLWSLFVATCAIVGAASSPSFAKDRLTEIHTPNPGGVLTSVAFPGNSFDASSPFFQSLGTNGRSCASCHAPSTGWTISPAEIQDRFDRTQGLDPIFRRVDGS